MQMSRFLLFAVLIPFGLPSCVIYLDKEIPVVVRGQVLDERGRPVAAANVRLESPRSYFPGLLLLVPHQMPGLRTETATGPDGQFKLEGRISSSSKRTRVFAYEHLENGKFRSSKLSYTPESTFLTLRLPEEDR